MRYDCIIPLTVREKKRVYYVTLNFSRQADITATSFVLGTLNTLQSIEVYSNTKYELCKATPRKNSAPSAEKLSTISSLKFSG